MTPNFESQSTSQFKHFENALSTASMTIHIRKVARLLSRAAVQAEKFANCVKDVHEDPLRPVAEWLLLSSESWHWNLCILKTFSTQMSFEFKAVWLAGRRCSAIQLDSTGLSSIARICWRAHEKIAPYSSRSRDNPHSRQQYVHWGEFTRHTYNSSFKKWSSWLAFQWSNAATRPLHPDDRELYIHQYMVYCFPCVFWLLPSWLTLKHFKIVLLSATLKHAVLEYCK